MPRDLRSGPTRKTPAEMISDGRLVGDRWSAATGGRSRTYKKPPRGRGGPMGHSRHEKPAADGVRAGAALERAILGKSRDCSRLDERSPRRAYIAQGQNLLSEFLLTPCSKRALGSTRRIRFVSTRRRWQTADRLIPSLRAISDCDLGRASSQSHFMISRSLRRRTRLAQASALGDQKQPGGGLSS